MKVFKGFVVGIVIIGILFSLNITSFGQSVKRTPEPINKLNVRGNLVNGGFVSESPEYIFYSNSDIGLLSIKKYGGKTKVISKYKASNLNVIGNYIYCSLLEGKNNFNLGFYSMKMDGTDIKKITDSYIDRVNIHAGWIYFLESYQLYKMKIDGTSKKLLVAEIIDSFCIENNYIYYIDHISGSLYKVDMNGNKKKELATNVDCQLTSADNYVYYICTLIKDPKTNEYKSGLFKVGKDDKSSVVKYINSACFMNAFNGWIYYSDSKDMKRIKVDGTKIEKICTNEFDVRYDLNIVGDWLFYSTNYYRNKTKFYKIRVDGSGKQEMNPDIKVTKDQKGLANLNACGASINYPKNWELVEINTPYLKASCYPTWDNNEDVFISLINPRANFGNDGEIHDIQKYYYDNAMMDIKVVIDENNIDVTDQNTEILTFSTHYVSEDKSNKDFDTIVIIKKDNKFVGLYYYALTNNLREKYKSTFNSIKNSLTFN